MAWAQMQNILNFSQPLDCALFDQVIASAYDGSSGQEARRAALQVIAQYQQHPDSWTQADQILQQSGRMESKFVALQALGDCIESRWSRLSQDQRLGIRNFIAGMCMNLSRDAASLQSSRVLLEKLNYTLVQVLKKEWPHNWPSFIPDIVESSKGSDSWMQNNLAILRQLSEEIFDFSKWRMTQQQIKERKEALNKEFMRVFQMVVHVLETKDSPSLVCETLLALEKFLGWIPLGYIFQTDLISLLGHRFLPSNVTRNYACRCLTEIGALTGEDCMEYTQQFINLYIGFVTQIQTVIPVPTAATAHTIINEFAERSTGADPEAFISNLAEFFTSFHRNHLAVLEGVLANQQNPLSQQVGMAVQAGHMYLVATSYFYNEEVFKTCVEYWRWFAVNLHSSLNPQMAPSVVWGPIPAMPYGTPYPTHPRVTHYEPISQLARQVLTKRMTRPEEVIVFEDENGEVVHQQMKDVAAIAFYEVMREALVYLTHLNPTSTEALMIELFEEATDITVVTRGYPNEWSPGALATLCWAVGSISGAMDEAKERDFVVKVLRNLLGLCEAMKGKANKASIASNIMYVVGQYPRFLKAHWRFLRTVIAKLLEFMHETFEGVQEMACETLLKITNSCKEQFVMPHQDDPQDPTGLFICELLRDLHHHTQTLRPNQLLLFYESVGMAIRAAHPSMQEGFVSQLLQRPNHVWQETIARAQQSQAVLADVGEMQKLGQCLKMFVRVAHSIGPGIQQQVFSVFESMMKLYGLYSTLITQEVAAKGETVTRHHHVRCMRIVKKEILRLVEEYVKEASDLPMVSERVLPPLMDTVLSDFSNSLPTARDAQVLSLMTAIAKRLDVAFSPHVPKVLMATLQVTLAMITANFTEFPEHRVLFFKLLQTLNHHCFDAFLVFVKCSPDIVNSVIWAFRHTEQSVQDTGLETLLEMLQKVQERHDVACDFFAVYLLMLLREVFSVLTDTMHKTGFSYHCKILQHLIAASKVMGDQGRQLQDQPQGVTAVDFVKTRLAELLGAFDTVSPQQRTGFIEGMFAQMADPMAFKSLIRDFLVQLKSFAETSTDPLAEDRAKQEAEAQRAAQQQQQAMVPGLAPQVTAAAIAHQPSTADIGMD
eukprot:Hpha_TRINITY_DN13728_c0_g1::TRINITY_DN13728_c0_g1_i1::g.142264::m.142264/K14290/XPO1, CRM1; exportin-1